MKSLGKESTEAIVPQVGMAANEARIYSMDFPRAGVECLRALILMTAAKDRPLRVARKGKISIT